MISPETKELIDRFKILLKEKKRLQAEYRVLVADLESQFREIRGRLQKKHKPN